MSVYIVKQGDCIASIALRHGFFWETIWNSPENADLRTKRKNPNVLLQGDGVFIPEKQPKQGSEPTEAKHRYVKKGTPSEFRMIVEEWEEPVRNAEYILEIDGTVHRGRTNGEGLLEATIPPSAVRGRLRISHTDIELEFGAMDPVEEVIGVQARLQNLGFYGGDLNGESNEETTTALAEFQRATGLPETGQPDQATRDKLYRWQDELHDPQTAGPEESSEPGSDDERDASDEDTATADGDEENAPGLFETGDAPT